MITLLYCEDRFRILLIASCIRCAIVCLGYTCGGFVCLGVRMWYIQSWHCAEMFELKYVFHLYLATHALMFVGFTV